MINRINKEQWLKIINNYFTNYNDNEQTRIKRRNYRALYLSNNDYLMKNNIGNNTLGYSNTYKNIQMYNQWYLNYYNKYNNL